MFFAQIFSLFVHIALVGLLFVHWEPTKLKDDLLAHAVTVDLVTSYELPGANLPKSRAKDKASEAKNKLPNKAEAVREQTKPKQAQKLEKPEPEIVKPQVAKTEARKEPKPAIAQKPEPVAKDSSKAPNSVKLPQKTEKKSEAQVQKLPQLPENKAATKAEKQLALAKPDAKKIPQKPEVKPEPKKEEPKKSESKDSKKPEPKKEDKQPETKKPEPKKEDKKVDPKKETKTEDKKPDPKKDVKPEQKDKLAQKDSKTTDKPTDKGKETDKKPEKKRDNIAHALMAAKKESAKDGDASNLVGTGGTSSGSINEVWLSQIMMAVRPNWSYATTAKNEGLICSVKIKLNADGTLAFARLSQSSGNPQFDASALNAVHRTDQSDGFPTPPSDQYANMELFFRLDDLQ